MIVARLEGGLGNQMFQYAAGFRLATLRGVALKLDISALDDPAVFTPRSYELGAFSLRAEPASAVEIRALRGDGGGWLGRVAAHLREVRSAGAAVECGIRFDPRVLALRDGAYLRGYWQSERYFEDVSDLLRGEFAFREPAVGRNAEILAEIEACAAVSLHVRRGDYAANPAARALHGLCAPDYYRRAVELVREHVSDPTFVVFSDEPDWVRANLVLDGRVRVIDHNGPAAGAEDLRLMSRCAHHVIANSTFSWWGAWLDPRPNPIVIAPRRWFADPSLDASDLLPARWVAL